MTVTSTQHIPAVDEDFVAAQREELLARRSACLDQVRSLSETAVELTDDRGAEDLGDDESFGEGATLSVERDRVLSLTGAVQRRIDEIDAALARMDTGAYGTCEACHQPIPAARLEVVPEATRCVSCKSKPVLRRR